MMMTGKKTKQLRLTVRPDAQRPSQHRVQRQVRAMSTGSMRLGPPASTPFAPGWSCQHAGEG
jgi:hypothetical protein